MTSSPNAQVGGEDWLRPPALPITNRRGINSPAVVTRLAVLTTTAAALLALAGCGSGGSDPPRATQISISPDSATLSFLGETTTFTARVLDQDGRPLAGVVSWASGDESIFTVNTEGEVTAVENGTGTLTATIASLSATASVTVEQVASTIEIVAGDGQEKVWGSTLPEEIVVRVMDAGGSPVTDVSVSFAAATGNGTANPDSAETDAEGKAFTTWTLGDRIGRQVLSATASGDVSVEITAHALRTRPRVVTSELPDAHADLAYSAVLEAESGSGSGYSWTLQRGDLPAGFSLATTGEISGVTREARSHEFEVRVTDGEGGTQAATLQLRVCEAPLDLEPGEYRVFAPTSVASCGFALRASEAGEYYRVTLVGRTSEYSPDRQITLGIRGNRDGAMSILDLAAAQMLGSPGLSASPGAPTQGPLRDPHVERISDDRRKFAELAAAGNLRPLPDQQNWVVTQEEPPDTREFTRGSPGTLADNCELAESRTAELVAFNDYVAAYAEADATPALNRSNVQAVVDFYGDFGATVIDEYFGGVSDVDGDGRITVFLDAELPRALSGVVWLGDFLSKEDCEASNEAELMRLNPERFDASYYHMAGTLVHEAQHITSSYQWILRNADEPPLDVFGRFDSAPIWLSEGLAEIARESASRLAWEAMGGPSPHHLVSRQDLQAVELRTVELHGLLNVLAGTKIALSSDPHSFFYRPYGAGWHFLRFLGDWHGNASAAHLADAGWFRQLNDSATPGDVTGLEQVTGRSLEDLLVEYAIATSLAGTSSPTRDGVPVFSTYDFTGLHEQPFFELPGRFPWPVTTTGTGRGAQLWLTLGVSRRLQGQLGQLGLRIHDFRAHEAGEVGSFRVLAPHDARVVVLRLVDQSSSN